MKKQLSVIMLLATVTAYARPNDEGLRKPPRPEEFVQHFDQNGDGQVSPSEFPGPQEHFRMLDKNQDGFISEDEAPTGPPPGRKDAEDDRERPERKKNEGQKEDGFIERLDLDRDGFVSREEFDGPADHFKRFDKNGDGFIDQNEAPTGPPPGQREGERCREPGNVG